MGKVRVRKESNNLFIDFYCQGVRCREQTMLRNTVQNRKRLEALLEKMEAEMLLNTFSYEEYFPNSINLKKFNPATEEESNQPAAIKVEPQKNNATPTFKAFAEQWFAERNIEWRNSHIRNVRSLLDSALIPAFGAKQLHTINKTDLLNFRTEQAKIPGRGGNSTISPKTLNTRMGLVKLIMVEASDRFGFENPYRNIKPLKLQKAHIEPFSLAEVNKIIETVRLDYKNYYILRFFTGMRTGEIDGLQWKFIDFERKQILVRETLIAGETEYTKTNGSQREIPMLGPVFDALKQQKKNTGKVSKYVFCNTEGKPLEHNNVTKRVWYPLLSYLGLTKRRPYQTRHTAATLLLASGENPEWVARLLGHSSTEMLFNVYSRYIPNATRQDGSAFDRLIQQQTSSEF
ncbi:site-specific integrase [Marinospirillum minutulum]|uniref:site-specific integrase n=1 Tax=Marinospirillum minutulum TaxID=64974 RepID=UPI000412E6F7|nr:site-specific integrase [Marinospirillum minutulum]